jgi:hypothetical protein
LKTGDKKKERREPRIKGQISGENYNKDIELEKNNE